MRDWAAAGIGLGLDGWLYAAAGFTPNEAVAALGDGSLDVQRARLMAGLRGIALPVG